MTTDRPAPAWLRAECERGIVLLQAIGLRWRPDPNDLEATVAGFAHAIANGTSLGPEDAPRVRFAFTKLASTAREWPSPAEVIAALPRREPVPEPPKLTRADDSAERAALAHMGSVLGFADVLTTVGKEPIR